MRIEESAEDFLSNLRSYQGRQVITGMGAIWDRTNGLFQRMITRLFYGRSEGILLAKRLNKDKQLASSTSQLLSLSERLNPKVEVLKALPQYYITLFNGKSTISKEFWIERVQEERQFKRAVKRYKAGYAGGVLLLGDRNSGKTAFSRQLTAIMTKANSAFILFPPTQGSVALNDFHLALAKATQKSGDIRQILSQLPKDATVIINDMELFWERSSDGLAVIELLLDLIDEFGHKVLFIVNMNPHAYKLINQMTHFSDRFIEVINMMPFDAAELKDLVLKRHRSSRLGFSYQPDGGELNPVQIANLFNSYFNYSQGNPGTALHGWLSNIRKVSKESLKITKPDEPSLDVLKSLNEDWTMMLTQFVLHKRLTEEKIIRITQWPSDEVRRFVLAMLRSGSIDREIFRYLSYRSICATICGRSTQRKGGVVMNVDLVKSKLKRVWTLLTDENKSELQKITGSREQVIEIDADLVKRHTTAEIKRIVLENPWVISSEKVNVKRKGDSIFIQFQIMGEAREEVKNGLLEPLLEGGK